MVNLKRQFKSELKAFNDPKYFIYDILEIDWLFEWQEQAFIDFYENDHTELVACVGQRSGKTLLASLFATYELFRMLAVGKPNTYFNMPKGSDIFIINVATNQQQAKDTVFSEIESRIENCDWFKQQDYKKRAREYEFFTDENSIFVRAEHSNSASLAGHTAKMVLLDELARFKTTGGERSASLVYETLKRTLATFGRRGKIISISSPQYKDDFMMQLLRHGKKVDDVMTIHKPTWECNPNIKMEDLQMEFDRNPESAWRDFGAQPPESLEAYFKEPYKIEESVVDDMPLPLDEFILPEIDPIREPCYLAGDPAYKNDRFGLALAYRDDKSGKIKVPLAHAFDPTGKNHSEIDAQKVVRYIIDIIEKHNVVKFLVDIWNYPSALQKIRENGVMVEQNTVQKKEYDGLKEKIYKGEIEIPPNDILIKELKELELINGQKVDHPKSGSKDIADAVANAVNSCELDTENAVEPIAMVLD